MRSMSWRLTLTAPAGAPTSPPSRKRRLKRLKPSRLSISLSQWRLWRSRNPSPSEGKFSLAQPTLPRRTGWRRRSVARMNSCPSWAAQPCGSRKSSRTTPPSSRKMNPSPRSSLHQPIGNLRLTPKPRTAKRSMQSPRMTQPSKTIPSKMRRTRSKPRMKQSQQTTMSLVRRRMTRLPLSLAPAANQASPLPAPHLQLVQLWRQAPHPRNRLSFSQSRSRQTPMFR